jgi:hypothetical protein
MTLAAPVAAVVQHLNARERAFADLTKAVAGYEERAKAQDLEVKAANERITELSSTVARLSGFTAGAFTKLGFQVTAEAGATAIDVKTEPLPPSAQRRPQVKVTTKVPAPAPSSR